MSDGGGFNELIHASKRLRICALLAATAAVEFATLRDALEVSDSVLSKHLSALEDAGYISSQREKRAKRLRVWVSLTRTGRQAYQGHLDALRQITRSVPSAPTTGADSPPP
ncbi:MAG TPA: transcriptional regulator [Micromonosporaceae bacterium]|nr:transcriptional regulator [Micromonosporaceae bacterium]